MKIIAFSGNWVLVDTKTEFIFYNYQDRITLKHKKKDNPDLDVASVAKWGYYRLEKPVEISSFNEVNRKLVNKAKKGNIAHP